MNPDKLDSERSPQTAEPAPPTALSVGSAVSEPVILHPIGVVHNQIPTLDQQVIWEDIVSIIDIQSDLESALTGLAEFSHIIVIFAFQRERLSAWEPVRASSPEPSRERLLTLRPMGRSDLPEVGVLATRSPRRPTPVGVTAVRLLSCQGTQLRVLGLDAADGTPVLDIKPYLINGDCIPSATVAPWVRQLWG